MSTTKELSCSTSKTADGKDLDEPREASFVLNSVPETMEEAVEMYGEETVQELFFRSFDVKAQGAARSMLKQGFSKEQIQEKMGDWRPDESVRTGGSPDRSIEDQFEDLDEEQQEEVLQKLAQRARKARDGGEQAEETPAGA